MTDGRRCESEFKRQESANAAPHCVGCGYSLRGHGESGRCPECGSPFDPVMLETCVRRPRLGWFLLLIPPLLIPIAWFVGACMMLSGGLWVILCAPIFSVVLSVAIARRLAEWRYGVVFRSTRGREGLPPREAYELRVSVLLVGVQLLACIAVGFIYVVVCILWISRIDWLPHCPLP